MENIDKMQNKCALPGYIFRDETDGALGRFMQGQRTGCQPGRAVEGSSHLTSFGKLEEDVLHLPARGRPSHSFLFSSCAAQITGVQALRCQPVPNLPIVNVSVSLYELFPPLVAIQHDGNLSLSTKRHLQV